MSFLLKRPDKARPRVANRAKIIGHADVFSNGRIKGWALDLNDPKSSLWIDLYSAGDFISSHDANASRADLLSMGLEYIDHGFEFDCGLPATALNSIDLIARRKDMRTASTTTNLAVNFISKTDLLIGGKRDAGGPIGRLLQLHSKSGAEARDSNSADPFGLDVDRLLRTVVSGSPLTVIAPRGGVKTPVFVASHAAEIDVPIESSAETLKRIGRLETEQSCIVIDSLLQYGIDYRLTLSTTFEKLKVGGYLVVSVPSQILYERKLQLPSRLPSKFNKFYTSSILLTEVEEAIDPFVYRVRFAGDLDEDYRATDLDKVPDGRSDVLVVIEKIEAPVWLDHLQSEDRPTRHSPIPTEHLKPAAQSPYVVISPDTEQLKDILVLQLDHRGDFVMGADARRLIRDFWPDAHITLICGSWNKQDALTSGVADTVLPFDFFAEDVSAGAESLSFDQHFQLFERLFENRSFDLAVDLRLGADTRPFLSGVSARTKAGFDTGDEFPWLDIRLPTINPERASKAWQRFVPACEFHTCGEHNYLDIKVVPEDCERANGRTVIWGPYMDLPFGRYEFVLKCTSATPTEFKYDIAADSGETVIGGGSLKIGAHCDQLIHVRLPEAVKAFELRIYSIPGRPYPPVTFNGMQIIKRSSLVGLHQRENMNLLAYLVALRLQRASVSERVMQHAAG